MFVHYLDLLQARKSSCSYKVFIVCVMPLKLVLVAFHLKNVIPTISSQHRCNSKKAIMLYKGARFLRVQVLHAFLDGALH